MSTNENTGLQKSELIKKLEAIAILRDKGLAIKNKMNNFTPEDNYERKVIVPLFPGEYGDEEEREEWENAVEHEDEDAIEQMAQVYDMRYQPREPRKPEEEKQPKAETPLTDEYKKKKGFLPFVVGFVAVCALISGGLFSGDTLTMVLNIAIIAPCVIVLLLFYKKMTELKAADKKNTKLALENWEQRKKDNEQKYEQDMKNHQALMNSFKLSKADFVDEYSKWRTTYLESVKEEAEIEEKLEADRIAAVEKIENEEFAPVLQDLADLNDLVTTDYLPALDIIINLLKSGRADDLKEALNLYEDIVYRERQLQFEREKEEQRQYEEKLRRQDAERRHQEDMRFREDQERQRRYEEESRQREAERRHREDMELREKQERDRQYEERRRMQEERRRNDRAELNRKMEEDRATRRQCNTCALVGHCSMAFRRPNCASYRPK